MNSVSRNLLSLFSLSIATLCCTIFMTPAYASAADKHACDYLKQSDVERIMAVKVVSIEKQDANPMGQNICFFDTGGETAVRFAQLQIMRTGWSKKTQFDAPTLFANNMSFLDGLQAIDEIGDRAYWGGSGMKLGAGLHVVYKDAYFTIQAATGEDEKNLTTAKKLAEAVLTRLK